MTKPKTAKEMLDAIDEFFATSIERAEMTALWDVLTALRGPDEPGGYRYKQVTTAPLRSMALPKTAARLDKDEEYTKPTQWATHTVADFRPATELDPYAAQVGSNEAKVGSSHFNLHLSRAIDALRRMGR